MNVYSHRRSDSSLALYIDGNLQFDSLDEAIYHESLALPALCLAGRPKRALVCGGGDGLALREILRFPGIESVTLVDCSPEVLDLARTELAALNAGALEDRRVTVVVGDALEYPLPDKSFDVIVCDFTFPTTKESALGFTVEWYEKLKAALSDDGVIAVNAVSPQNTASAFACLVATLRAAGLKTLPYRVCIPSFRSHGYGAWGFILASRRRLTIGELRSIRCPVPTRQADLPALARGAHFGTKGRYEFATAPINRAAKPVLQSLLLNPSSSPRAVDAETPPDFPNLLQEVEIRHPYHSRNMIETLAEHVAGSLQSIDLRRLVDELTIRAKKLPQKIREELINLRAYLSRTVLDLDLWGRWAARLFATLILVMTIANSISPDPAFAKGGHGLGHASFSRGFGHATFGGGGSGGSNAPISGRGFTSTYGREPVDIYGYHYAPRIYFYDSGWNAGYAYAGSGRGRSGANVPNLYQPKQHKPLFVLDDDLLAMDNGDFVIPLSDAACLVVSNGQVNLLDAKAGKPLMAVYAEPKLFDGIRQEVSDQSGDIDREVANRKDWLSWVGWTSSMFGTVKSDTDEFMNLQDLKRRLGGAIKKLGNSPERNSLEPPADASELFVGCHVLSDNRVAFHAPGGGISYSDGTTITDPKGNKQPISPQLKAAVVSVLKKMIAESKKDIESDLSEQQSLRLDQTNTERDLSEYQMIQSQNGFDPTYEVDYGTDSIPVGDAIQKTQQDLAGIGRDQQLIEVNMDKTRKDLDRFQSALQAWS